MAKTDEATIAGTKTWRIPTILAHLRVAYFEATGLDIMDKDDMQGVGISDLVADLRIHHMQREMDEYVMPGQLMIDADEDGQVSVKEAK